MSRTPEQSRQYYLDNKQRFLEKAKRWALENPERVKENSKRWQLNNLASCRRNELKYRKNSPRKYLFNLAKRRSALINREFSITLDDIPNIPEYCPLLGIKINSWSDEISHHPSLDRIDSSLGYIPGNVQIISHRANLLKNNASSLELLHLVINWMEIEENIN